jgi:hypothetical protein
MPWQADWGTVNHDEEWHFDDQTEGRTGGYCLRLGGDNTFGSFGVYQQVPVVPGRTYRLDMQWRGEKRGSANWFEVLLLDGPWNPAQADSGDPIAEVEPNYMYAYDNNTYGLPGLIGDTFGWIWGHEQYAPPEGQVDWNSRYGRRVATHADGAMTVVLKAGTQSSGGVAAWFDEVSLCEVRASHALASVPYPTDPVSLTIDTAQIAPGAYPAELRVSVFDAALNEASRYRNVTVKTIPDGPWACVDPTAFDHTIFVGENVLETDTFSVWNCGIDTLAYDIAVDSDWLQVIPAGGEPPDATSIQHTIVYDCSQLRPGLYTGTITVAANQNVQTVVVHLLVRTVAPDIDWDGDVDQTDAGFLQACLTGPTATVSAECERANFNGDAFVDHLDWQILLECRSGTDVLPVEGCAGPN